MRKTSRMLFTARWNTAIPINKGRNFMLNWRNCLLIFMLTISSSPVLSAPSLTLYNDNFAVVRDIISLEVKKGINPLDYQDITQFLEPDSVVLRPQNAKIKLKVLEQNYLSEPINQALLLKHYEGKTIEFEVVNGGDRTIISGKVIRSGHASPGSASKPMIESEGKVRFGLPGTPLFPPLQSDALLKPSLQWLIDSDYSGKVNAELAYLTSGLGWKADYNVIARSDSKTMDLNGWVTFQNQSGKSFKDAKIKLLAGDVNKIQAASPRFKAASLVYEDARSSEVQQKDFDEYHLYTIGRKLDLQHGETKQVEFVNATGIESKTLYKYDGSTLGANFQNTSTHLRTDPNFGLTSNKDVAIVREFKNTKTNGLGIPLPKGRVRFYQQDADQQLEFLGENSISHTPNNETISLYTGNAFDIKGERTRIDFEVDSRGHWVSETFAVTLTNQKKIPVVVTVIEHLYRWVNWDITESSDKYEQQDSDTITFNMPVKPEEKKTLKYTVKYTW